MGRIRESLRARAKDLKKESAAIYYAYQDPRLPLRAKAVILLALGYSLSPIDLIPDFIPVLGYLDDLVVVPALLALALRLIPGEVMAAARKRAENESVRLKKNWLFACLFILVWIALLLAIFFPLVRLFKKSFSPR